METAPESLTLALQAARAGDRQAADRAYAVLYPELLKIARARLRAHQPNTLLDTQALVHESFMRFVGGHGGQKVELQDRHHFFTYAAKMMRNIVTDFARRKQAERRGGGAQRVTLDTGLQNGLGEQADLGDVLDIDRVLTELEALDAKLAQVVEMRFFGGYDDDAIAQTLGVTDRSVRRYWDKARAFMLLRLQAP